MNLFISQFQRSTIRISRKTLTSFLTRKKQIYLYFDFKAINLISIMAQTHVKLQSAKIKYLVTMLIKEHKVSIIISLSQVGDLYNTPGF